MNGIYVRSNESFDKAIRRFSKMCDKAGVLYEVKKSMYYEKPSEERKRKRESAKIKMIKDRKSIVKNYEDRRNMGKK